jgi:hypothetical protein
LSCPTRGGPLELADALAPGGILGAQGGVLSVKPGERGRRLDRARLPLAGDATPGGADPLRATARQGPAADVA